MSELLLTVTDVCKVNPQGSVVLIEGIDQSGHHHWFGTDPRLAGDLIAAAQAEGEVLASVESWQLWGASWRA